MDFLKKFNVPVATLLKIAVLGIIAVVLFGLVLRTISSTFGLASRDIGYGGGIEDSYIGVEPASMPMYEEYDEALSVRNVVGKSLTRPQDGGYVPGVDAEDFEVTEYGATIETRHLDRVCKTVADLKIKEYVIFENSNSYDNGCSYTFKVAHENVDEVLLVIEELHPRTFNEHTSTIKRTVDDYTSRVDILEAKLAVINETLENAVIAYDDVTTLATRTENAESLAAIIDSKLRIIERLTQEKLSVTANLEQIERTKAEQLDRLLYTNFRISITEQKLIDGQWIADSWKSATRSAIFDINSTLQNISVTLVALLFTLLQFFLYLVIAVFVLKYSWKFVRKVWKS